MPRLLTIMGSGETAPTMVSTHRAVFEEFGPRDIPAVLLDTPYGFQENADEITARTIRHFEVSVDRTIGEASLRSADRAEVDGVARFEAKVRAARLVFAGPGSPTYAAENWQVTHLADILASKLERDGGVTFASAAAVTLGKLAVPVYEIYKVGHAPHWVDGLDLLGRLGIEAVVIPHFDNAEGGTHDTRYCYLGRRRLEVLEAQLPPGTTVIGVDEHTACIIDFGESEIRVRGKGALTIRIDGNETIYPSGLTVPIDALSGSGIPTTALTAAPPPHPVPEPLVDTAVNAHEVFDRSLANADADGAVAEMLALEQTLTAWSADPTQTDATDRARSVLRSMIVQLGEAATEGLVEPRKRIAPYVDALLAVRAAARDRHDWELSDLVRGLLTNLDIEVRDGRDGTEWTLRA